MPAAVERVHSRALGEDEIVWHVLVDPASCGGACDMYDIAGGEPGISAPGGNREVPADLHESDSGGAPPASERAGGVAVDGHLCEAGERLRMVGELARIHR